MTEPNHALSVPFEALRSGEDISDATFDAVYPYWVRELSSRFWSPVVVARQAAEYLAPHSNGRILDVGAGVGKFCLVGACTTAATFYGVEQRPHLVAIARDAAHRAGVHGVKFIEANITEIDWGGFDGIYFYNPFAEHAAGPFCHIDATIEFCRSLRDSYLRFVRRKLRDAPPGTRVATYHGLGGEMPREYRRLARKQLCSDFLEVWERRDMDFVPFPEGEQRTATQPAQFAAR